MEQLSGAAKAAVLLLSLDEERAVKIVEHLDEEELRTVQVAAEQLGTVNSQILEIVYGEFAEAFRSGMASMKGSESYLRDLVTRARGEQAAVRVFSEAKALPAGGEGAPPLASLAEADPQVLGLALAGEHPQVIAAVLAHIDPALGAHAVQMLPVERQADVFQRMAALSHVPPSALADVERGIKGLALGGAEVGEVDGVGTAAAILNEMAPPEATNLLDRLGELDPERAVDLRRAMFTFENLIEADTRGLQQLLREIPSETLLAALKTASEELKEKLLSGMSKRAAEMVLEELALMGPMRLSEVERAQQEIVDVAMRLVGEGKLSVKGQGDGMV